MPSDLPTLYDRRLSPGQQYTADEQCQLIYGHSSFYCAVSITTLSTTLIVIIVIYYYLRIRKNRTPTLLLPPRRIGQCSVIVVVCLFVCKCLLTTLHINFSTNLHEILREGWQWANEQMIKFGGDPDHTSRYASGLGSGSVSEHW